MDAKLKSLLFVVILIFTLIGCQAQTAIPTPTQTALPPVTFIPTNTATGIPANMPTATTGVRISKPGKYLGYSKPIYSDYVKTSQYIPVRDGTKLAANIYRPAQEGKPVDSPLPVIWALSRYNRNILEDAFPWFNDMVNYGYVLAIAEIRGTNASFGSYQGVTSESEGQDAYDITEWFAAQSWSDGNIGMFGSSYLGTDQYMAAIAKPPHLKAIFPTYPVPFDNYSFFYPGGILYNDFLVWWSEGVKEMDSNGNPIDEDKDATMLADAIAEHKITPDQQEILSALPYRDSREPESGQQIMITNSGMNHLVEIQSSGVPIYHRDGWLDAAPRDILIAYKNLGNPQKIIIGPWSHFDSTELELIEHVRWFDYWLKGIDNGIMDEAPIYYYTMGLGNKVGWHEAWQWPLPDEQRTKYYFIGGPSGSVKSVNDGLLGLTAPENVTGSDKYTVDYSTSSGEQTRISYYDTVYNTDQTPNDAKGLTYTTPLLASDVEVTGHPVIHFWITSTAKDGDFFAYLEDVDASNNSHYVTQGQLRASLRAVSTAPYDYLGLPYHRSYAADASDLPKEPVELVFDLQPTSYVFFAGHHRIRVTITCADQHNFLTPQLNPAPTVSLYRDAGHPSYIDLPVIP